MCKKHFDLSNISSKRQRETGRKREVEKEESGKGEKGGAQREREIC